MISLRQKENGWLEIIINEDCDNDTFITYSKELEKLLGIEYKTQIGAFNCYYFDFWYNNVLVTLHYNNYMGISIVAEETQASYLTTNDTIRLIFNILSASV